MRKFLSLVCLVPVLAAGLLLGGSDSLAQPNGANKLAILIAAPQMQANGLVETEMPNDIAQLEKGLLQRGYRPDEILKLSAGILKKAQVLEFLKRAAAKIENWRSGTVVLMYSGHGAFQGNDATTAKAALSLQNDGEQILWATVFETLRLPRGVTLILLPDGCFNNLLTDRLPANVTAVVMKPKAGNELKCFAQNHYFSVNGVNIGHGVISWYALQSLPQATTVESLVQKMVADMDADVAAGKLPAYKRLPLIVTGATQQLLPGAMNRAKP